MVLYPIITLVLLWLGLVFVTPAFGVQQCTQPDGSILTVPDRVVCAAIRDGVGLTPLQEAERRLQAARDGLVQFQRECVSGSLISRDRDPRRVEICTAK